MSNSISVHQCLFCLQTFGTAAAKDDHLLEHFAREMCNDCHQDLIRIGGNLYVLHNGATCIREYDYDNENYYDDVSSKLATVLVEEGQGELNEQQTDEEVDRLQDDTMEVELGEWMKREPENYDEYDNSENSSQEQGEEEEEAATNDSIAEYSTVDEDSQQQQEANNSTAESNMDDDSQQQDEHEEKANISATESMNDENKSQEAMDLSSTSPIKIKIKLERNAKANTNDVDDKPKSAKKEENKRECEFCGEFFHRYALYRHKRDVHNPTVCICQMCNTQFKSEEYLQRHMRYKHGATANVFKCDKCQATFRKEDLFRIHQCNGIQLNDNNKMKCEKCDKEFSRKQTLLKHQVLVHSKTETIHCKACARVFSDADERDSHQFECSAKKNLQLSKYSTTCEYCGKVLSRLSALQRHMATQHQEIMAT